MEQGQRETARLRKNAEEQVERLMTQLSDLDELREARVRRTHPARALRRAQELGEEEHARQREATQAQLAEFNASLERLMAGDVTLVDALGAMKLAVQAAVSSAFRTPEVIKLFALAQPAGLRQRLAGLQRDKKLGKISKAAATAQALEILTALKKLGDALSEDEAFFLAEHMTDRLAAFETVTAD